MRSPDEIEVVGARPWSVHTLVFAMQPSVPTHLVRAPSLPARPPGATALHLTPPCSSLQGRSQKEKARAGDGRGGEPFCSPAGGSHRRSVSPTSGLFLRALVPSRPSSDGPSPPKTAEVFETSPTRLRTAETCLCPPAAGGTEGGGH